MHLGVFAVGTGNHIAGWCYPDAFKSASDLSAFVEISQTAERGKLDMFLSPTGSKLPLKLTPGFMVQIEPLTILSAVGMEPHTSA